MSTADDPDIVIVPVPALVVTLKHAEDRKGSPLTESEVLALRDSASCIALPRAEAASFIEARGYSDIDPRKCWEDWQRVRLELA
jgi:hypothetical protein